MCAAAILQAEGREEDIILIQKSFERAMNRVLVFIVAAGEEPIKDEGPIQMTI
jgi:hypothetical protein